MKLLSSLFEAEQFIFSNLNRKILMATPLGLGKPNQLINRIYDRVKGDSTYYLKIFTALSLSLPKPRTDLEARFTGPFYNRHFGEDYPHLSYVNDLLAYKLPQNIEVEEFYFQAGQFLGNHIAQGQYNSLNYTHVAQCLCESGVNLIVQLIAASDDGKRYSLSCNPDLTLDLVDLSKKVRKPILIVGVVHPDLPFLGGDAEVPTDFFDAIVISKEINHKLFAQPLLSIDEVESMIGFYASQLVCDDGTLQIGIGSLSDALVSATLMRHQKNSEFVRIQDSLWADKNRPKNILLYSEPFQSGLYGTSEMLMDGFMHLRKAGILKRTIFDHDEKATRYLHGAFFLGSKNFYKWLKSLEGADYDGLSMTRVSKVNDLYDSHEMALRRQRKNARFFNTTMCISLLGGAASETLDNGQVISGVGGQYNFVAMSHELSDSHSILMLRSHRMVKGKKVSNIVWSSGHVTIPRHLRDIVVTEYGIASLRGQNDETVIKRILNITDSEFQEDLLRTAKRNKKINNDYRIPEWARNNTADRVRGFVRTYQKEGLFPERPFGSDFTSTEQNLEKALLKLKADTTWMQIKSLFRGFRVAADSYQDELSRMRLRKVKKLKDFLYQRVLLGTLDK